MAEREVGRSGSFAGMRASVGRYARVGRRSAHGGELLCHGSQFGGSYKSQLDLVGTGSAAAALGRAYVFLPAPGPGSGAMRRCLGLMRSGGRSFCGSGRVFPSGGAGGFSGRGLSALLRFVLCGGCRIRGFRAGFVAPFPLQRRDRQQSAKHRCQHPGRSVPWKRRKNWVHSFNVSRI